MQKITLEGLVSFLKEQGFVFQGSEIYNGLSNSWDYGPVGTNLKENIRKHYLDAGLGSVFLNAMPKAQITKEKRNK